MSTFVEHERLARSGVLGLAGTALSALSALFVAILVGNSFGPYGNGLFFQAVGLFTVASQVLRLGTNSSLVRAISEDTAFGREGRILREVMIAAVPVAVLSTITSIVVWATAEPLAEWLASPGAESELVGFIRLMAPFIAVGPLLAVLQTATRMAIGVTAFTATHQVALPAFRLAAVGLAILGIGTTLSAFGGWLSVLPIWLLIAVAMLVRPLVADRRRGRARDDEKLAVAARRFWGFSSARALGGAVEVMLEWSDVLIVAALTTPVEAGIYAVVTRTVRAGQVVDQGVRIAVSPRISRHLALNETDAARALHTRVTRAMVLISWPFYLTLALMGPAVLSVFGPGLDGGAGALALLSVASMVASGAGMLQSILLQGGRSSWQAMNKTVVLALSIALNLLLVPVLGFQGAAITWAAVIALDVAIASWQVHRLMGVRLEPLRLMPAMGVALVVFGGGLAITRLVGGASLTALVVGGLATGSVYLLVLWFLRKRLDIESLWREVPLAKRFARSKPSPANQAPR